MRFENKVAAITGGGSGIGKETAKRFVAEGGKAGLALLCPTWTAGPVFAVQNGRNAEG